MEPPILIKCVVIGDSGVGKSSILSRYSNDQFNDVIEPTLGAAFVSKSENIKDKIVKLQIWDTAGQQKYQSIAPIYYRQSQVALCVYDISSRKTFNVMNNWIKDLHENGPEKMMIIVVGNKCDKVDEEQVSYQEAQEYSESINSEMFVLTSAKEGKGINEMFLKIANLYLDRKQKNKVQGQTVKDNDPNVIESLEDKNVSIGQKQRKKKCC